MKLIFLTVTLLIPLTFGLTLQNDDLVFDDANEETSSTPTVVTEHKEQEVKPRKSKKWKRIERFWGVPKTIATVGHIFKLRIPDQAFSGNIEHYEIHGINNNELPHWLFFDETTSTILGLPAKKDEGQHRINVKAYGKYGGVAKDTFTIRVTKAIYRENRNKNVQSCDESEDRTVMTIFLDTKFDALKPTIQVEALENLAGFLGLQTSDLTMYPHNSKEDNSPDESTVVLTGPGSVKRRKEKYSTCIEWQVGCNGNLWKQQAEILKQIHEQARDGTLSEVLQIPVFLWKVRIETSDLLRNRREAGSGDYGDNDDEYEDYEDYDGNNSSFDDGDDERDNIDDNESITELPPKAFVPSASVPKGFDEQTETEHAHRHHHGQGTVDWKVEESIDEQDIIPVINRQLEESVNTTSAPSVQRPSVTTTEQTSATQNSSSPTPSTVMMVTSPKIPATTIDDFHHDHHQQTSTIPTTAVTITNVTELYSTSDDNILTESIQETSTSINTIKNELESGVATVSLDNDTLSSTDFNNITINEMLEPIEEQTTHKSSTKPSVTSPSSAMTESPTTEAISSSISSTISSTTTTVKSTTEELTTVATTTTTTTTTTSAPTTVQATTTLLPETPKTTTEKIDFGVKNFPPRQDRRLKKIAVTAGKPLRYVIPANTFSDIEDGDTRNLQLNLLLRGHPVKDTHWLQFNKKTQEVYGLPLENDVSQWEYELVASDRDGLSVTDSLDIYVQQPKFTRSVNHEFTIYLRIDKRSEFPTSIDWQLRVIQRLSNLYGDSAANYITVRSIDIIQDDQAIFTWTNDSVPRTSECPKAEITKLFDVLVAGQNDEPSQMLQEALRPEIRVKRVVSQGIGQCENMKQPEPPKAPIEEPKAQFPPVPRNQVDHINATVGQLLVYRVPEDTFYDPEDGSARNMRMSLLTVDRKPIPADEWLQFDSKNQEFYGVPLEHDLQNPRKEYQLVVTDSDGASATDGLVVVIHPAPRIHHSVEFSMTLDTKYESFAHSAIKKRSFIEKLQQLFGDKDTNAIQLGNITEGSTIVTWRNVTLPTDHCPNDEIKRLEEVLVKSDKSFSEKVDEIMGREFPVKQISLIPRDICLGELTNVQTPHNVPASKDSTSLGTAQDDYLITFILPAIIIAAMVLLAGIIAFILYRRRRSGKMSVSEHDDERQSFRSKGIPVIFQDELEEKPDPGNKSPVILKEEKPPLPPPEYQKSDDGADQPMLSNENSEEPYQPPPPFARTSDNNRQNRPKPTPTYRKPPPYVPP